ncbi:MAG: Holliday junction resolvase RuvX [Candidatus Promineifilaceae bacterium]|nr:Holliday junction resolvase RuvX [Candidatus Promineifilaceae bacterium]
MVESDDRSVAADGQRILALDLGEKRIGVALSDELHLIARSYAVIERSSRRADFEKIRDIVREHDVSHLVVGLPIDPRGEEGPLARWVRDYTADLAERLGIDYTLWDERLTTSEASDSMRARGIRAEDQKEWIDAVAAAFILQRYLDAQRS